MILDGATAESVCKHCNRAIELVGDLWREVVYSGELDALCLADSSLRHEPFGNWEDADES